MSNFVYAHRRNEVIMSVNGEVASSRFVCFSLPVK